MNALGKRHFARLSFFQDNIADARPSNWRCRAGSRYLYVCEDGLVHYCSQQRGFPAKPLDHYTVDDIRREYVTEKSCAPYCTVSCVHYVSYFDFWRGEQTIKSTQPVESQPELVQNLRKIADPDSREARPKPKRTDPSIWPTPRPNAQMRSGIHFERCPEAPVP